MVEITRAKVGQDGAEVRQEMAKDGPDGLKRGPGWAKMTPRLTKMTPRWAKMDSRMVAILHTLCENCILKKWCPLKAAVLVASLSKPCTSTSYALSHIFIGGQCGLHFHTFSSCWYKKVFTAT